MALEDTPNPKGWDSFLQQLSRRWEGALVLKRFEHQTTLDYIAGRLFSFLLSTFMITREESLNLVICFECLSSTC